MINNLLKTRKIFVFLFILFFLIMMVIFTLSKANSKKIIINNRKEAIALVRKNFPEVEFVGLSNKDIESTGIRTFYLEDGYKFLFWEGSGDCPSGCIDIHEWYFIVTKMGIAQKVGEYQNLSGNQKGKRLTTFINYNFDKEKTKVDPQILLTLKEEGTVSFFIEMKQQVNFSDYENIKDINKRRNMIFEQSKSFVTRSQAPIIELLKINKSEFQSFWSTNSINATTNNEKLILEIASRPEVDYLKQSKY